MVRKIIALALMCFLVFEQSGFAQVAPQMQVPAYLSGMLGPDRFRPVHLRSLALDPASERIDLVLDKGDIRDYTSGDIEKTSRQLLDYFKIGLTLPNSSFWVNLRPDAPERVIDPLLENTDMGKVLLEADVQLKKDMAGATSPRTPEGKQYWDRLYARVDALFSADEDVEIPTFTRPWIVPGEIIIGDGKETAYIYKATLKVCLEQDYLKDGSAPGATLPGDPRFRELNDYSSQLIRELIIPKLTREVNSAKRYAALRQVYYSLILAQWFKAKSLAGRASAPSNQILRMIDSKDLKGLSSNKKWSKDTYFKQYRRSFSEGEYSFDEEIKDKDGVTVRIYTSGGAALTDLISGKFVNGVFQPSVTQVSFPQIAVMPYSPALFGQDSGIISVVFTGNSFAFFSGSLRQGVAPAVDKSANSDGGIEGISRLNVAEARELVKPGMSFVLHAFVAFTGREPTEARKVRNELESALKAIPRGVLSIDLNDPALSPGQRRHLADAAGFLDSLGLNRDGGNAALIGLSALRQKLSRTENRNKVYGLFNRLDNEALKEIKRDWSVPVAVENLRRGDFVLIGSRVFRFEARQGSQFELSAYPSGESFPVVISDNVRAIPLAGKDGGASEDELEDTLFRMLLEYGKDLKDSQDRDLELTDDQIEALAWGMLHPDEEVTGFCDTVFWGRLSPETSKQLYDRIVMRWAQDFLRSTSEASTITRQEAEELNPLTLLGEKTLGLVRGAGGATISALNGLRSLRNWRLRSMQGEFERYINQLADFGHDINNNLLLAVVVYDAEGNPQETKYSAIGYRVEYYPEEGADDRFTRSRRIVKVNGDYNIADVELRQGDNYLSLAEKFEGKGWVEAIVVPQEFYKYQQNLIEKSQDSHQDGGADEDNLKSDIPFLREELDHASDELTLSVRSAVQDFIAGLDPFDSVLAGRLSTEKMYRVTADIRSQNAGKPGQEKILADVISEDDLQALAPGDILFYQDARQQHRRYTGVFLRYGDGVMALLRLRFPEMNNEVFEAEVVEETEALTNMEKLQVYPVFSREDLPPVFIGQQIGGLVINNGSGHGADSFLLKGGFAGTAHGTGSDAVEFMRTFEALKKSGYFKFLDGVTETIIQWPEQGDSRGREGQDRDGGTQFEQFAADIKGWIDREWNGDSKRFEANRIFRSIVQLVHTFEFDPAAADPGLLAEQADELVRSSSTTIQALQKMGPAETLSPEERNAYVYNKHLLDFAEFVSKRTGELMSSRKDGGSAAAALADLVERMETLLNKALDMESALVKLEKNGLAPAELSERENAAAHKALEYSDIGNAALAFQNTYKQELVAQPELDSLLTEIAQTAWWLFDQEKVIEAQRQKVERLSKQESDGSALAGKSELDNQVLVSEKVKRDSRQNELKTMINKISRLDGGTAEALEAIFIALTSSRNDDAGFSGALEQLRQMAVNGEKLDYTLDMHSWISALEMLALSNQDYSPLAKQVLEAIMSNSEYGKEIQNYAMLALRNDAQKDGGTRFEQFTADIRGWIEREWNGDTSRFEMNRGFKSIMQLVHTLEFDPAAADLNLLANQADALARSASATVQTLQKMGPVETLFSDERNAYVYNKHLLDFAEFVSERVRQLENPRQDGGEEVQADNFEAEIDGIFSREENRQNIDELKRILGESAAVADDLRAFAEAGKLEKTIPFMQILKERIKDRDTDTSVFEHTLKFIKYLELIGKGDREGFNKDMQGWQLSEEVFTKYHAAFNDIASESREKLLLYFIVLLHDTGEAVQTQGHPLISARIAEAYLKRFGFTDTQVREARTIIASHVDLGTLFFSERSPDYFISSPQSLNIDSLSKQEKQRYLKLLALITLNDVRSFVDKFISREKAQFYIDVTDEEFLTGLRNGFDEYRLRLFSSNPEGKLDAEKFETVQATLQKLLPEERAGVRNMLKDSIEVFDYGIFFLQGLSGENLVKMFYLVHRLIDTRDIKRVNFTAPSFMAQDASQRMAESVLNDLRVEDLRALDTKALIDRLLTDGLEIRYEDEQIFIDNKKLVENTPDSNTSTRDGGSNKKGESLEKELWKSLPEDVRKDWSENGPTVDTSDEALWLSLPDDVRRDWSENGPPADAADIFRKQVLRDGGEKNAVQSSANVGGIDFRGLPITSYPAVNPALMAVPAHLANADSRAMDAAWGAIQKKMQSGPVPFDELRGYVAACSQRKECGSQRKAVSSYILNILKLEEEAAVATAPELKEILSCLS